MAADDAAATRVVRRLASLSPHDLDRLAELYAAEWWTSHRSREQVAAMAEAEGQRLYGAHDYGRLVAFARVLTDGVFKALVLDVVVDRRLRGAGLGAALMDVVSADLEGVEHRELYCLPELEPFYERWGFTSDLGELHLMRAAEGRPALGCDARG